MIRIVLLVVWLLLSAWLVIWTGEGLFGVNQRESILPFSGEDTLGAVSYTHLTLPTNREV